MPYVCKGPISRVIRVDDVEKAVQLRPGDRVPDELGAELLKTHPHALTRVPHARHNCEESCGHHSHDWNQQPEAKAEPTPRTLRRNTPEPEAAS